MSVHEFYRLKALITLEQVNTTEWSKQKRRILISKTEMVGCLQRYSVSTTRILDREMRRRLILYKKHDLLAKGCLLPTLSTSIIFICFWIDLVRVLAMTRNTSPKAGYTRV